MWNISNNVYSSKTIIPSFYTSQASSEQHLCFKSFIMASYQSFVNINLIMKFLIEHKDFVSLCTVHRCGTVVACALVTQRARVLFPVGTSFLGEVFSGFFLTCKTNVRKL